MYQALVQTWRGTDVPKEMVRLGQRQTNRVLKQCNKCCEVVL